MSICTKSFAIFTELMDEKIMYITNFNNQNYSSSVENQDNKVNFLSFRCLSVYINFSNILNFSNIF